MKMVEAYQTADPIPDEGKYLYSEWIEGTDEDGEECQILQHYYEVPYSE